MSEILSRFLAAPDDGSLGPVLRMADDRLPAGAGYGPHEHRAVDVVAVVLAGELRHRWGSGALLRAGDVALLRAGTGLTHDEVAGDRGARVLQTYLRSAEPAAPARHDVRATARGWVDLGRSDVRLWIGRAAPGNALAVPAGFRVVAEDDAGAGAADAPAGELTVGAPATVLVWQVDTRRPDWATAFP